MGDFSISQVSENTLRKLRLLEATGSERLVGTREQNACVTLATTNEKKQDPGEGETPGMRVDRLPSAGQLCCGSGSRGPGASVMWVNPSLLGYN